MSLILNVLFSVTCTVSKGYCIINLSNTLTLAIFDRYRVFATWQPVLSKQYEYNSKRGVLQKWNVCLVQFASHWIISLADPLTPANSQITTARTFSLVSKSPLLNVNIRISLLTCWLWMSHYIGKLESSRDVDKLYTHKHKFVNLTLKKNLKHNLIVMIFPKCTYGHKPMCIK